MIAGILFLVSGCTSTEFKDAMYAGGKIAYDSIRNMQQSNRPEH